MRNRDRSLAKRHSQARNYNCEPQKANAKRGFRCEMGFDPHLQQLRRSSWASQNKQLLTCCLWTAHSIVLPLCRMQRTSAVSNADSVRHGKVCSSLSFVLLQRVSSMPNAKLQQTSAQMKERKPCKRGQIQRCKGVCSIPLELTSVLGREWE